MFSMIRTLVTLAVLAAFIWIGATVPLGERTLFGHVQNIWAADETQELVDGVKDKSGPVVDRVRRGVEAGIREVSSDASEGSSEPGAADGDGKPAKNPATPDQGPSPSAEPGGDDN